LLAGRSLVQSLVDPVAFFSRSCHPARTMKHSLLLSISLVALTACVDTTGLSAETSKTVHPQTNANAAVSVVEYGDLQCPSCKSALTLVTEPMIAQYGSQIAFEFRQFPLASIHPFAMEAAEASECAADQGKFWDFLDLNYENQEQLSSSAIENWGEQIGLDMDLFNRCRSSNIKRKVIQAEYDAGTKLGVRGTPTYFVNGVVVPATIADIGKAIQDAVGSAGSRL